jgi:DNA-binding winged helix-turn-helix (wHTH) protein/tetratricopeptide (TPR) repeat protein
VSETTKTRHPGQDSPIPLAKRQDVVLGEVIIRPSLRTLAGPDGEAKGEPRVIQVLLALVDAQGLVLSRDDLLRLCWDGRIVGDDAVNRAVAEVRRLISKVGASFVVETVPRVGYRLSGVDWSSQSPAEQLSVGRASRRDMIAGGIIALALLSGGGLALLIQRRRSEIDALIERGRVLQGGSEQGAQKAERLFREAIARDSTRADAWGWLAAVLGNYALAREAAERALALDRKEANARVVMAYQRRDLESWTQWEDELLAVLADAPDNAAALHNLTFFYQGMGRCRDSWIMNERAIRIEPFSSSAQHRRALKHWIFGRVAEADRVADQGMQLWPRNAQMWNARMLIYACTDRPLAALALLDDRASRPENLKPPSEASWRSALTAIATGARADIDRAIDTFEKFAPLAPGIAANAIMLCSQLGAVDAAYRFAEGLLVNRGVLVQRLRGSGIGDIYSESSWARTQFLFIPATTEFRADERFPGLCEQMGHVGYWRKRGVWPDAFVRGSLEPGKLI